MSSEIELPMNQLATDPLDQQLTLNMRLPSYANWQNFDFVANPEIFMTLQNFVQAPTSQVLLLQGSTGTGKTHLLQATAQTVIDHNRRGAYFAASELLAMGVSMGAELLRGLEQYELLCIDDIDLLCHDNDWCEALFHLYNTNQQLGRLLLFSSAKTAHNMTCVLADLQSRLQLALMFSLQELDETQQMQQLLVRAHQLGLSMSIEVAQYICLHSERNMGSIMAALQVLDAASWQAKRKLTIPFVKQFMHW